MNKKFNIIKLSGLKGLMLILFVGACLLTGFLVFPGWVCMHVWNYTASYFMDAPVMTLLHGVVLWCIIALSLYAINRGNFSISFNSVSPSEEKIKRILAEDSKDIVFSTKDDPINNISSMESIETIEDTDKVTK